MLRILGGVSLGDRSRRPLVAVAESATSLTILLIALAVVLGVFALLKATLASEHPEASEAHPSRARLTPPIDRRRRRSG